MKHSIRYEAYLKIHPDRREELEERAGIMETEMAAKPADAEDMAIRILEAKYNKRRRGSED